MGDSRAPPRVYRLPPVKNTLGLEDAGLFLSHPHPFCNFFAISLPGPGNLTYQSDMNVFLWAINKLMVFISRSTEEEGK